MSVVAFFGHYIAVITGFFGIKLTIPTTTRWTVDLLALGIADSARACAVFAGFGGCIAVIAGLDPCMDKSITADGIKAGVGAAVEVTLVAIVALFCAPNEPITTLVHHTTIGNLPTKVIYQAVSSQSRARSKGGGSRQNDP